MVASIATKFADRAYQHAQTDPNSEAHRVALHMATIADQLPRNNLRLLVRPLTPHKVWFYEASARVRVARSAYELVEARHLLACHLDLHDRGGRAAEFDAERREKQQALDNAIVDALRTPTTRKSEVRSKQEMIGKREWAEEYRPEWQAMIDEDLARYPTRATKPRG